MKYALTSRILHWVMAILIIFLLGLGIFMSDFLSEESPNRMEVYNLHKSLGVLVLILLFLRVINRLLTHTPPLPFAISALEKKLAKFGHLALYFLMFTTPFSGYLMSSFAGYPVKFFSFELPNFFQANFIKLHLILLTLFRERRKRRIKISVYLVNINYVSTFLDKFSKYVRGVSKHPDPFYCLRSDLVIFTRKGYLCGALKIFP